MRFYIYTPSSVLALLSTAVALECYYPDGKIGSGLVPCNTTASVTHCCRKPDVCLTNGLCYSSIGSIIRRGCTDKTWNSTECPSEICTTGRWRTGDAVMTPCGEYQGFCCGQDSAARSCCNGNVTSSAMVFKAGDPMTDTAAAGSPRTVTTCPLSGSPTGIPSTTDIGCPRQSNLEGELRSKNNVVIALATVLGCTVLLLAWMLWAWAGKRRQLKKLLPPHS